MALNCENFKFKRPQLVDFPYNEYNDSLEYPFCRRNMGGIIHSAPIIRKKHIRPLRICNELRCRLGHVQRNIDIPVFRKAPKIVEIPEVREITRFIESVKIVDVPIEQVRIVPKLKIREVEKIRHVPGPIEYVDIPQEHIIQKPYTEIIEKIHEVPEIEDVEIEVPIYVPTPIGPPKDIHINIPLPYDVPQFCFTPEKKNLHGIPYPIFQKMDKDPSLYIEEDALADKIQNLDEPKTKNQKIHAPSKDRYFIENDIYQNKGNYKKKYTMNNNKVDDYKISNNANDSSIDEEFHNYYEYKKNKAYNENEDYSKYASKYAQKNKSKGATNNEYNFNAAAPFDKYYYSYSAYNQYKGENEENNNNYIYNDGFLDKNLYDDNGVTELIVKKKRYI
ncbi:inner membrane complex protein 1l, putative [Plasmodium ovale]|uniref:Inner membrane complex protein 1l, putative n=2 Tax=Plasmodium ovale TaxID=36330 RepID=A0A1A8WXH5_PLAOA|nr:inner membrane complex protein 1l, putative [Plasmodium ovale curtisi]SBS97659.1 inner membrane complex protein 1l, putative [Plasmodium ovale curtisi]SCP06241.1 inner membrane complex protein 1l, putative [Plasmodium ovale]